MRNLFFYVVSLLSFVALFPFQSRAQLEVAPEIEWKTLRTPHFEVIFNAKQQDLGLIYAEKLEIAHEELKPYFRTLPKRTIVIINDKTDITNGYATRIPYPHIMIYPVLPGPEESLADTGDWAFELLAHEYTHILTFEPANGIMYPLRHLFGNIISPNMLLPQWWKEGIAVEMESRLGQHGRLRSFYQDATIRAMVENSSFKTFDIAQANEVMPSWPQGARPYLFGSLMWSHMLAKKGASVVADLHERHGGRIPYFIETPARDYLEKSYSSTYKDMQTDIENRVHRQIVSLRATPPTEFLIPQNSFQSVSAPAISPDGLKMAVITESDSHTRSVRIVTKSASTESFLNSKSADTAERFDEAFTPGANQDTPASGSIRRISWFPNSQKIIYDKIAFTSRIERYSDLFIYDLQQKKTVALTKGLRGREPAVAPSGNLIAAIQVEGGKTSLVTLDPSVKNPPPTTILVAPTLERFSYPTFIDDQTLIFSWRKLNGEEHLYRVDLQNPIPEKLFPDHPTARFAKKTREGLIFSSTKNGVPNIYLADKDLSKVRPLTHTLTGAWSADADPYTGEYFLTLMTAQGLRVAALPQAETIKELGTLPAVPALLADRFSPSPTRAASEEKAQQSMAQSTQQDYSPAGYLWPRYWIPFLAGTTTETGLIFDAITSGFDPLKKHSYSLIGSYDTGINEGSVSGSYLNQTTRLPFTVSAYRRSSYLGSVTNTLTDTGGQLSLLPDTHRLSVYVSSQVGWNYITRTTQTSEVKRTGPFGFLRFANYSQAGAQISPEGGYGAYLGAFHYLEGAGYLSHSQFLAGGQVYYSRGLPSHHALMFRLKGIYTPEDISPIYGASTDSIIFSPDTSSPEYILRGYKRGQVFGKNLASMNLEYRFPLWHIYKGSGTDPVFLRRLSGAVFVDSTIAEGRFVNNKTRFYERITLRDPFTSAGLEAKLDTTLGYVVPFTFVLGYAVPFQGPEANGGVFSLSMQFKGF